jgi:hypothetical protein
MHIASPGSWHPSSAIGLHVVCSTCFMNHATHPVLVFEQNRLTRTIHDPSWYHQLILKAQA